MKNRLAEFAREVVKDPNVAPSHGWRHNFKTLGRELEGVNKDVLDAIQGHGPADEAADQRVTPAKAMMLVIESIPGFEVQSRMCAASWTSLSDGWPQSCVSK